MKLSKNQIAILLALTATMLFGWMSWFASTGAFENPEPTQFQQLEMLWRALYWIVPALLIGRLCRRPIVTAAATKLLASFLLLAWNYPSFTPAGSLLPHPARLLVGMAYEVVAGIPFAAILAWAAGMALDKGSRRTIRLAIVLVPVGMYIAWTLPTYLSHWALMARWNPEKARTDVAQDIAAGSMKIYVHGSFAAFEVGIEEHQHALIEHLPRVEAGVGCVISDMDVFDAQGEYAIRYNKAIVEYLQRHPGKVSNPGFPENHCGRKSYFTDIYTFELRRQAAFS